MEGLWPVLCKHLGVEDTPSADAINTRTVDTVDGGETEDRTSSKDIINGGVIKQTNGGGDLPDGTGTRQSQPDNRTADDCLTAIVSVTKVTADLLNAARTEQPTAMLESSKPKPVVRTQLGNDTSNEAMQRTQGVSTMNEGASISAQVESASLTHSVPPLSESGLTLPVLPPPYLEVLFKDDVKMVGMI